MRLNLRESIGNLLDKLLIIKNANPWLKRKLPKAPTNKILRILGNGKSLNEIDFNLYRDVDYMVVNRHVLANNYTEIKPRYYVLADPHFFEHQEGISILQTINAKTTWNILLLIPYNKQAKRIASQYINNDNIQITFYNICSCEQNAWLSSFLYEHQLAMPVVQNVIVACIMLGIVMAYSKIELYGVEHNWLPNLYVGDDNLVYLYNPHFYDKEKVKPIPQKDIQHLDEYPLWLNIAQYSRMFKSYWQIKKYLETSKCQTKIINKTKNSFIDAFERE